MQYFQCLLEMLNHASFLYTTEIESVATLCFRAFEGSNYEVRCAVAKLLGTLVAMTQLPAPKGKSPSGILNLHVQLFIMHYARTISYYYYFSYTK